MLSPAYALCAVRCVSRAALDDPVHIDAGQVDVIGIEAARRHDLFDLDDTDLAAHGGGRVEVARGLAEHQVTRRIGLPGLDDGQIGDDAAFQNIGLAVELFQLLALGNHGAHAGLGVEPGDARAARAHALGQRALGVEFQLQLSAQILAHEFRVLADVGRDHLLHLAAFQQQAQTEPVHARVVGGHGQVLDAIVADRRDQQFGDAAQAKAARRDEHAVEQQPIQRFGR